MNPDDTDIPGDSQRDFEELSRTLSPLRELQPPPETRTTNATRVSAELIRLNHDHQKRRQRLWRKRIAVPLPVAAVMALALVILSVLQIRESGSKAVYSKINVADSPSLPETPPARPASIISEPDSATLPCEPVLYQEQTVVAGLGTIRTIQYYKCESEQQ